MKAEAVVVGGGPAGSTAAAILAKHYNVAIIEEHGTPGEPVHCAGLVTPRGVPAHVRRSVLSEVRCARLHSPLGFELTLESKRTRAFVIDRTRFDKMLFEAAVDAGATPFPGTKVSQLSVSDSDVGVRTRTGEGLHDLRTRIVMGADGARSVCRKAAGLPPPRHLLRGIQVDLRGVKSDSDTVDLYFGNRVAPGFFAWSIPAEDITRVGLCTWRSQGTPATHLSSLLSWPEFSKGKVVSKSSGLIPIGPRRSAVGKRIMLVGDAACHAKPLSGGGVYTGIKGAELAAPQASRFIRTQSQSDLETYDGLWKEAFGKELARAFRVRKVFLNLSDKKIDKALRIFAEPDVRALLEEKGDIDYPASLSASVLKLAPKLAQFSPQIIESLL